MAQILGFSAYSDLRTALNILRDAGPAYGLYAECSLDGFEQLRAPLGNRAFTDMHLREKIEGCRRTLQLLHQVDDPRAPYHIHRLCASACLVKHASKLADPRDAREAADVFDTPLRSSFTELHGVKLTDKAWSQASLAIRLGGLGFVPIAAFIDGAAAASIIDAAPARAKSGAHSGPCSTALTATRNRDEKQFLLRQATRHMRDFLNRVRGNTYSLDLDEFDPSALATAHTHVQTYLKGVMQKARARALNPDQHTAGQVRDRIRGLAFRKGPGASFLLAHHTLDSEIHTVHWKFMLRRHLGLLVYDDSLPRICEHCSSQMDALGDHATDLCCTGFGRKHRHDTLRNVIVGPVARAAGLDCQLEAPLLIPDTELRPADILVHPPTAADGSARRPIACDIAVISPYREDWRTKSTRTAGGAASAVHRNRVTDLERKLSRRLPPPSDNPTQAPNFEFQPLAFDSLGTPAPCTVSFFEGLILRLAMNNMHQST